MAESMLHKMVGQPPRNTLLGLVTMWVLDGKIQVLMLNMIEYICHPNVISGILNLC